MTDETTNDETEVTSFTITTERIVEEDFTDEELEMLVQQTDADNPESALAEIIGQHEANSVPPRQKLIDASVEVVSEDD